MKDLLFFALVLCSLLNAILGEMTKPCQVYQPSQPVGVYLPAIVSTEPIVENDWKVDLIFGIVYWKYLCVRFYTEGEHVVVSAKQDLCDARGFKVTRWPRDTFSNGPELYISKTKEGNVLIQLVNSEYISFLVDEIEDETYLYLSIGPLTTSQVIFNCPGRCHVEFGESYILNPFNSMESSLSFHSSRMGSSLSFERLDYDDNDPYVHRCQIHGNKDIRVVHPPEILGFSWNHVLVQTEVDTVLVKLNEREIINYTFLDNCNEKTHSKISVDAVEFWTKGCRPQYPMNFSAYDDSPYFQGRQYDPEIYRYGARFENNLASIDANPKEVEPCRLSEVSERKLIALPTVLSLEIAETTWTADLIVGISHTEFICFRIYYKERYITFTARENACESDGFNVPHWPTGLFGNSVDLYITKKEAGVIFDVLNIQSIPFTIEGKFSPYLIIAPTTAVVTFNCPGGCHMEFGDSYIHRFSDDGGNLNISYYSSAGKGKTSLLMERSPCYDVRLLRLEQLSDVYSDSLNYITFRVFKNSAQVKLNDRDIISHKSEGNCPQNPETTLSIKGTNFWVKGCRPYVYDENGKKMIYESLNISENAAIVHYKNQSVKSLDSESTIKALERTEVGFEYESRFHIFKSTTTKYPEDSFDSIMPKDFNFTAIRFHSIRPVVSCKSYGTNKTIFVPLPVIISGVSIESYWTVDPVPRDLYVDFLHIRFHSEYEYINVTTNGRGSDEFNKVTHCLGTTPGVLAELYIYRDEADELILSVLNSKCDPIILDYNPAEYLPLSIGTHATSSIMFNCPGDCRVKFGDVEKTEMFSRGNPFGVSFYSSGRISGSSLRLFDFHFDSEEDFVLDQLPAIFESSWNHLLISIVNNIIKVHLNKREVGSYEIGISWPMIYEISLSINGTEFWTEGCHPQHPTNLAVKLTEDDSEDLGLEDISSCPSISRSYLLSSIVIIINFLLAFCFSRT